MGNSGDLLAARVFELPWRHPELIEEPDTAAQEDGHEVDADLVEQPRPDELTL